jgi:hypothetical protein
MGIHHIATAQFTTVMHRGHYRLAAGRSLVE